MNPEQQKSILAIALYAAFADGAKHDREREEIRRIAESLSTDANAPDLAGLYQDVLLKRVTLEAAADGLTDPGERQLAYEMAVCVCDADGRQSETEYADGRMMSTAALAKRSRICSARRNRCRRNICRRFNKR